MSEPTKFKLALFRIKTGPKKGETIRVHFNPVSLQYSLTKSPGGPAGKGTAKKQVVTAFSGKLTMDVIFDTTHTGEDVRVYTEKIAQLMEPVKDTQTSPIKVPPIVEFEWGTYSFPGLVESYKETIDFFSGDGVPLRASINLTLERKDHVFSPQGKGSAADAANAPLAPDAVDVPMAKNDTVTGAAARAGSAAAAHRVGTENQENSLRFPTGDSLTMTSGPASFVSSALSAAGNALGGEFGSAVTAAVAASGRVSAGVSASAGAFTALRTAAASVTGTLRPERLLPSPESASVSASAGALFDVDGRAAMQGAASMATDVGAGTSFRSRIQFDQE